jgi:hypothetical protein
MKKIENSSWSYLRVHSFGSKGSTIYRFASSLWRRCGCGWLGRIIACTLLTHLEGVEMCCRYLSWMLSPHYFFLVIGELKSTTWPLISFPVYTCSQLNNGWGGKISMNVSSSIFFIIFLFFYEVLRPVLHRYMNYNLYANN